MAECPYLPLWTDAYLADTRHLSTVEHGAYLLLLMEAWRRPTCALPDDDRMLARLTGLSEAEWSAIKPAVMDFWTLDGRSKTWVQKRLQLERAKSADRRQVARDKAARRWNGEKKDDAAAMPGQCTEDANQSQNQSQNHKDNPPNPPKGGKRAPDFCEAETVKATKPARGSRLPGGEDWTLPERLGQWAVAQGLSDFEVRREVEKFRDHWIAVPGAKGRKLDWDATWRSWVRRTIENREKRAPPGAGHPYRKRSYGL